MYELEQKTAQEVETAFGVIGAGFRSVVTPELIAKADFVANLLTIKMNDLRPWYETKTQTAVDTTAESVYGQQVRPGQLAVIKHVSAKNQDSNKPVQIAIQRGGETLELNTNKSAAAAYTINWDGQVILSEGDRVKCTFYEATAGDVCRFSYSGYEIKA